MIRTKELNTDLSFKICQGPSVLIQSFLPQHFVLQVQLLGKQAGDAVCKSLVCTLDRSTVFRAEASFIANLCSDKSLCFSVFCCRKRWTDSLLCRSIATARS